MFGDYVYVTNTDGLQGLLEDIKSVFGEDDFNDVNRMMFVLGSRLESLDQYDQRVEVYKLLCNFVSERRSSEEGKARDVVKLLQSLISTVFWRAVFGFMDFVLQRKEEDLEILFYSNCPTEDTLKKRCKKLRFIFHSDKITEVARKPQADEIFTKLSNLKDSLIMKLNAVYGSDDIKLQHYLKLGEEHKKLGQKYSAAVKLRNNEGDPVKNLATLGESEHQRFQDLSEQVLKQLKKDHYFKACTYYHSALVLLTKQSKTDYDGTLSRLINIRQQSAVCHYNAGNIVEAQLYLISALHLALNLDETQIRQKMDELNAFLAAIKKGTSKSANTQRGQTCFGSYADQSGPNMALVPVMANFDKAVAVTVNKANYNRYRNNARSELRNETNEWVVQQIIRADGSMTNYHASQEEITRTQEISAGFIGAGVVVGGAGVVMAAVPLGIATVAGLEAAGLTAVGGAAALISMTGVGAIFVCSIAFVATVFFGAKIYKKGRSLAGEPAIRAALNEAITNGFKAYSEGNTIQAFIEFSNPYNKKDRLFIFETEKNGDDVVPRSLTIVGKHIVEVLLSHGFRADGIAYILNILAEGLISGGLKFAVGGPTANELNVEAKKLFKEICDSTTLEDNAKDLDQKVFRSRSEVHSSFLNSMRQKYNSIFNGVPESYFEDAQTAPFLARLQEMRNIAFMNQAILNVIEGTNQGFQNANENLNKVRQSVRTNYQYFSVNAKRLEAIEDFLFAVGFEAGPDPTTPPPTKEDAEEQLTLSQYAKMSSRKLRWGEQLIDCFDVISIDASSTLETLFYSEDSFRNVILSYIDDSATRDNAEPEYELTLNELKDEVKVCQRSLSLFKPKYYTPIARALKANLILCARTDEHYVLRTSRSELDKSRTNFFICLDMERNPVEIFRAYLPEDLGNVPVITAALYQKASDKIEKAKASRGLGHVSSWYAAYEEVTNVLNSISVQWRFLWVPTMIDHFLLEFDWTNRMIPQRELFKEEVKCINFLMECLINMSKFVRVLKLVAMLKHRSDFKENGPFWYWYALALRQSRFYYDASSAIHQALTFDQSPYVAAEEKKIRNLNQSKVKAPVIASVCKLLDFKLNYDLRPQTDIHPSDRFYDIFSYDGGGIRGVIPAYILSEVERRAKLPISSLVNMQAGTSTGSIIAAGLCSVSNDSGNPLLASDLVKLYTTPVYLKNIFNRTVHVFGLTGAMYGNGRGTVLQQYLGQTLLMNQSVNDLVIVAVKYTREASVFTSFGEGSRVKIYDAAMASSAAPTYFPAYQISGETYIDGGMHANNPAQLAVSYAQNRASNPSKIRVWSFGTGDIHDDPFETNKSKLNKGGLHYLGNAHAVAINGQQGQVDTSLTASLKENYHRWQVWLDSDYQMDDYKEITLSILIEHARQFIEDNSDSINSCVESLLKNKGY